MEEVENELYQWSPEFIWQIIRRTKSYPIAYENFKAAASKTKDTDSLQLLDTLIKGFSKDYEYSAKENERGGITLTPTEPTLNRYAEAFRSDPNINASIFDLLPPVKDRPHLINFLNIYGDLMRFPVPPVIERPAVIVLDGIFTTRPARVSYYDCFEYDRHNRGRLNKNSPARRVRKLIIEYNENHPPQYIAKEAAKEIKKHITIPMGEVGEPTEEKEPVFIARPDRAQKVSWSDFESQLRCYDLAEKVEKPSWVEIGPQVYTKADRKSAADLAKKSTKRIKELIEQFER